ncbi:MAG: hypothetical protein O3B72_10840, partial [Proteobacteria bacterium]|nr:hypothetical protein [Pseudomonadota bacterium]
MPRFLPLLLVILSVILQGCGGSGGDTIDNTVINPPAAPMDGINGRVASRISGGIISVTDATGSDVVVASGRTTSASGEFNLVFSEFAIDAGINPPLTVTLDGSSATAVCDYNGEGDNDCLTRDGDFAAFGETYDLPAGFSLRGIAPTFPDSSTAGDRNVTVNLTAASDLATQYALNSAAGSPLDADGVNLAARQALGLVEFITNLPTAGLDINSIPVTDITASTIPDTPALAVALFGASLHGQVDTTIGNRASYRRVLDRVSSNVTVRNNDQPGAASSFLAGMITPYLNVASTYQASLPTPSAVMAGSIAAQLIAQSRLETLGASRSSIALPADPASNAPLDRSKVFTNRLAETMGATLLVSDSGSFAGTPAGADIVYRDQLQLLNSLVSQEVRQTLVQLDTAIAEAL